MKHRSEFAAAVERELTRLRAAVPERMADRLAVTLQVLDAALLCREEARRPHGEYSKAQMVTYLVELAALCQRAAEDVCGLTTG